MFNPLAKRYIVMALAVSSALLTACQNNTLPTATSQNVPAISKPVVPTLQQHVAHTLIVMHQPTVDTNRLNQIIESYQGVITHRYSSLNGFAVRFPEGTPMARVDKQLRDVAGVTSVETDSIQTIQPIRNVQ